MADQRTSTEGGQQQIGDLHDHGEPDNRSGGHGDHGHNSRGTSSDNNNHRVTVDEFRRNGIVMLAKTELDGSDVLCSGVLIVRSATLGMGPMLSWVPDEPTPLPAAAVRNGTPPSEGSMVVCGSLNDREWTVVRGEEDQQQNHSSMGVALGGSASSKVFVR